MHIPGVNVDICARYEVSVITPVAGQLSTNDDASANIDANDDTWQTIHDCIGSSANEPIKWVFG